MNVIHLVPHREKEFSYISDRVCKQLFNLGYNSVPKLIEHINFNKPENLYISNIKDKYVMAFNGTK
jgi:hypothetical protein